MMCVYVLTLENEHLVLTSTRGAQQPLQAVSAEWQKVTASQSTGPQAWYENCRCWAQDSRGAARN